ncbi:MAG TPA: malectin domain-containing carbohydrate-binding protein [Terracidiphilus sp.]|jgi:hypothetical protein|nr:malectin domain-containing carbohydrate-binding protein [Terracidiphilus sp.]
MTIQERTAHAGGVNQDRVVEERAALQAVLASRAFEATPRLARLLQYVCERYFEGDTDGIKEYSIATDVFRRPESFDQATDSIVRVEVFRLRKKLREFYDGEGADQPIEIVVATGHYRPEFIDRAVPGRLALRQNSPGAAAADSETRFTMEEPSESSGATAARPDGGPATNPKLRGDKSGYRWWALLIGGALLAVAVALGGTTGWFHRLFPAGNSSAAQVSTPEPSLPAAGPEVRIRCGYSRAMFKDDEGNIWAGDRYFTGGFATELPNQHIARTRNSELYLTARSGVFSYKIPLARGTYELRLHFAETTYTPASTLGGGENSRVFGVQLNGRPLLTQFDIVSDAGPNTADVRVFRDISPDKDGYLHLDFSGSLGLPMVNAIEIVPGLPHRLRPIRMVAQNSFFVDKSGNLWMPDTYFSSGRLAADKVVIGGTTEPELFTGERYGNFSYALPVDDGSYKMTLYFSEKYWGSDVSKKGGVGSRVFDIFCNGSALARRLDIVKEVGAGQALIKVYHGLHPNAQGKLVVSFVPDVNYASVNAVEVVQEGP